LPSVVSSSISYSSSSSAAAYSVQDKAKEEGREEARGQDARDTRGQDVRDTRGQDVRDTRGQDVRDTSAGKAVRVEGAFQTLPLKGAAGPVRFVSYSDCQGGPQRHAMVAAAVRKELPFDFLSISGDLCNDGGRWDWFQEEFFGPARDLLRETALWTARGNHEMEAVLFRDIFGLPDSPVTSFDAGSLHFVIVDPYRSWSYPPGAERSMGYSEHKNKDEMAAMLALLEKDLAAADAEWIIVTYHDPTFNIGGTGSTWGRTDLLPVLEKHGVDLVLCGHAHLYERCRPIGPAGGKPIIHITHGGGGGPSYPLAPSPLLEASYSGLHYCRFTIEGNRLEMVAKLPTGETIDRLVLFKTGGSFQDAVMERTVETGIAMGLCKVFKLQRTLFDRVPQPGVPAPATILATSFPTGCKVSLEAATGCPWGVQPMTFVAGEQDTRLMVTAPPGVRLTATPWMGYFEPELKLKVTVTEGKTTSTCDGVPVLIPADCLAKLHPAPQAADVPPAPAPVGPCRARDDESGAMLLLVFGEGHGPVPHAHPSLGDKLQTACEHGTHQKLWDAVEGLPLPSLGGRQGSLKLSWTKDGLYGALSARTGAIEVNAEKPWEGDCLELSFETDGARRLSIPREPKAGKIVLYPRGDSRGEGVSPSRAEGILPSVVSSSPSSSAAAAAFSKKATEEETEEARGQDARGTRGQDVRDTQGPVGVAVPAGELFKDKLVTALWRKTDAGYDLEFFIPAAALAPVAFEPGGTMGFDYVLRKGGRAVEQFIDAARVANTSLCPFFWGKLRLAGR
jgi:hypothetical protein